ncbi:hypothetical protein NC652_005350 [Populus alba x Populus x berolinensis]|uniref:Uncharacterized protein n=1 Tax=Populus alba x Populus x berolinensis TaxID=444605 RepID=A0AAD6WAV9_9ROSI|nr:hypothetical protein NC652_005350 [Populus alba x Populus x berolinensis]KAJ7005918.1 hypothetical protein NC653_005299 [Populus alba x Populus x berolinensis]
MWCSIFSFRTKLSTVRLYFSGTNLAVLLYCCSILKGHIPNHQEQYLVKHSPNFMPLQQLLRCYFTFHDSVGKPVFQSHDQILVLTRGGHYQDKSDRAGSS